MFTFAAMLFLFGANLTEPSRLQSAPNLEEMIAEEDLQALEETEELALDDSAQSDADAELSDAVEE